MNCYNTRIWCQKILPLVYDDSLSYYEVLCRILDYIKKLIENDKLLESEIESLKQAVSEIQNWINNFDTSYVEELIAKYIATMIFVAISDSGYIIYYIPQNWKSITFNTTELDIHVPLMPEYGHLVLSY